ncbi:MAG: hypothetical protein F4074_03110 [Synechococcus sp. SB0672_bin_10]|nr:hypothetical protein [Synechococcus sp. SB0672_bin_10]
MLFFPLESTYRLMKLNSTLLYPLAVCGALPLVLALRRWTIKQGPSTHLVFSLLAVFHIGFHVSAVTNLGTWPGGIGFARTITLPQDPNVPIVVFACEKDSTVPWSHQYHERLVGLDLALHPPGAGHSRLQPLHGSHDRRAPRITPTRHAGCPIRWSDH